MRDILRNRMGWLHAWVGFVCGVILVVVFTGGTLAMFDTEITHWMQPELSGLSQLTLTEEGLNRAGEQVQALRDAGQTVFLNMPSARDPVLRILHYDGHAFVGPALNPRDGSDLNVRQTQGGQLFFDLHQSLYRGPVWGNMVTELVAIGLLVAVFSGIVIHFRNLVPDLLLFRPFAAPGRAWLDAHLMAGVLMLPFIIMITYTGAVIHAPRLFPMISNGHGGKAANRSGHDRAHGMAPSAPLGPMWKQAEAVYGAGNIGFIRFEPRAVSFYRSDAANFVITRDHVDFSPRDGQQIAVKPGERGVQSLGGVMRGLHYARWGTSGLRWLYFICGAVGSAMMSAGLVLFVIKHRRNHGGTVRLAVAEAFTLTVTFGLPFAALGFLWSNRLIAPSLPQRDLLEAKVFFLLWLCTLVHAAVRSCTGHVRAGWREQAWGIAVLGCGLPVLDVVSRGATAFAPRLDVYGVVDACALGFGLLAVWGQSMIARSR
ncbi:MAG: PepSY-associated TM helix domain-containing protein [Acetobacter papayae]